MISCRTLALMLVIGGAAAGAEHAQQIQIGDMRQETAARKQAVELDTAAVTVSAGHPDWVELRFRVQPGMHINSHVPHDELLIPTSLDVSGTGAVKVVKTEYPTGIPLHLDVGAGEVLSTFQGEFAVRMQVVAPKGDSDLQGVLRYQACDARSCFPPKTLPVRVGVVGR